jgi:hypothetical protein
MISSKEKCVLLDEGEFFNKNMTVTYGYTKWHDVLFGILILLLDDMNTYFSNKIPRLVSRFN